MIKAVIYQHGLYEYQFAFCMLMTPPDCQEGQCESPVEIEHRNLRVQGASLESLSC